MAEKTAADRVRGRIRARLAELHRHHPEKGKNQQALARKLRVAPGSLSELLKPNGGQQRGLLFHLDTIAHFLEVPPSALIMRNESIVELQDDEPRLIAYWRKLPKSIQRQMIDTLTFVAGLLPEEREQRRWWVKIRRIGDPARRAEVEQLIDDILQRQRPGAATRSASADQASSPATAPSTRSTTKKQ